MSVVALINVALGVLKAFAPVIALALIGLYGQRQQAAGAALEATQVTAQTAVAETAIAQAEAQAPTTQQAVVDRLKAGTF